MFLLNNISSRFLCLQNSFFFSYTSSETKMLRQRGEGWSVRGCRAVGSWSVWGWSVCGVSKVRVASFQLQKHCSCLPFRAPSRGEIKNRPRVTGLTLSCSLLWGVLHGERNLPDIWHAHWPLLGVRLTRVFCITWITQQSHFGHVWIYDMFTFPCIHLADALIQGDLR